MRSLTLTIASCLILAGCVQVDEPQPYTDHNTIRPADMAGYDVVSYKDPETGCRYLIFIRDYDGSLSVTPRLSPGTDGDCVDAL
jgi:hypothetical protein